MKTLNRIFIAVTVVAFLTVASFAQQGNAPQTLSTTTLSASIPPATGSTVTSQITLASISNVYATVSTGTVLWVDTEAMDVVTNSVPASGTTLLVQRGSHGTRAQSHVSGRTVYVGRPNNFQGYPPAGSCWTNSAQSALPTILPWINLTDGYRYNCKSDGIWYRDGRGSQGGASLATVSAYCNSGSPAQNVAEYLNNLGCTGATVPVLAYVVSTPGELANLYVTGLTSAVAANANVFAVYKNGSATAITCTVAIAAKTCSDTTHSVATVAGDYIQFLDTVGNTTTETLITPQATVSLYGQ